MTEAEARNKRCPLATGAPRNCIASQCMGWRETSPLVPGDGYCGFAGPPPRQFRLPDDEDGGTY